MASLLKKEKPLVAAIDFGTTFSGYAYSFKDAYKNDACNIHMCQSWNSGSLISLKAPTCVLLHDTGEFHSFGYEAENNYTELALNDEHRQWYFFKRFKMGLYREKKVTTDISILDETGKSMKALLVYAAVIRYLKDNLLKQLEIRGTLVENDDIHWVLTVPAIWSDSSKYFMREAAREAGIDGSQLSIALEPEAASLYCQMIPGDLMQGSEGSKFSVVSPGTKYMVIDLGGGTADITVHERQHDGTLEELHKASGGAWGGTKVDEEFTQLIIKLVGGPAYMKFCEENKDDQLDLQRELETKKRTIKPDMQGKVTLKVPVSLGKIFTEVTGETLKETISQSQYNKKITWDNDKMRISVDVFKGLFKQCTEQIVTHVKSLLAEKKVRGTNIFLMVGGFSESEMMQDAIKKALPNSRVIVPQDSGLVVLKGAVIFGHRPVDTITSRVSKCTYGINISPAFDPTSHDEDHKIEVAGVHRCRDVFKRYIRTGETVRVGEARSGKHVTLKESQKEMLLKVFATDKEEPKYVDEEGVDCIGKVVVKLPDVKEKIRVEVRMMFGDTELTVESEELSQHTKCRAYFDFR